MPGLYPISGILYDTDGTTALASATVKIRNENTNKTLTETTNSSGQYVFDCGNLEGGWTEGDKITIYVIYQNYDAAVTVTINLTTFPDGIEQNLTLVAVTESALKLFAVQEFVDYFQVSLYDDDNANGIKPQTVVKVGQMIEKQIENLTNRTWDDNGGSYYTSTDEMHDVRSGQKLWWTKKTPVVSVTNFYVNTADEGSEASWSDLKADDTDDLNINLAQGRIQMTSGADDTPEIGKDQVKITYTYGQSTPADIKLLAILMTGRAFGGRTLQRLNISANEVAGLSSAISNLAVDNLEIDRILKFNSFPPIGRIWN